MAAAALLAGAGCGNASDYIGTWEGRYQLPVVPGQDPAVRETLAKVSAEVRADGTCTVREEGFRKDGTWRPAGGSLVLTLRSSLGRPLEGSMGGERTMERSEGGVLYSRPGQEAVRLSLAAPESEPR
jgi:hypothetical protein